MSPILIAVLIVSAIGLLCAFILVIVSHVMAVPVDDRFPVVRGCLPGANCGACGYAGCDGYAKALLSDSSVPANLCIPGGDVVGRALSDALGVEFKDVDEQYAVVHCRGNCDVTDKLAKYEGVTTCKAASLLYGGAGQCSHGCIGFGDCLAVCQSNAICLDNGIARIDPRQCIGCGMCVRTCPQHLISLISFSDATAVGCSSRDKGALTRKICTNGCIGCKKCEKVCESGAITVQDNLAVIDYEKCIGCGQCAQVCTAKCILSVAGYKPARAL